MPDTERDRAVEELADKIFDVSSYTEGEDGLVGKAYWLKPYDIAEALASPDKSLISLMGKLGWIYEEDLLDVDFGTSENYIFTALNQGATCCEDKHQTYYGAIMRSPQWKAWIKEQHRRHKENPHEGCFDIDESMVVGAISTEHLQAFFEFVKGANTND